MILMNRGELIIAKKNFILFKYLYRQSYLNKVKSLLILISDYRRLSGFLSKKSSAINSTPGCFFP